MLIIFYIALVFTDQRCTADQSFVKKTVSLGENVTLTCSRQSGLSGPLFWIKLVVGSLPEVVAATYTFDQSIIKTTPRFNAEKGPGTFIMHITKTKLNDTAFYYCQQVVELQTTLLNKTFLRVRGSESDITADIEVYQSYLVRPGDSVTLQCSVLSDSEIKTCSGDHKVLWFRAGSDESPPSVIYAHGKSDDECVKSPEAHSEQRCVYSFSKNVSSSDAGTYYCAVATCGGILFGNGTKLDVEAADRRSLSDSQRMNTILILLCSALALSLVVVALLMYTVKEKKCNKCKVAASLQTNAVRRTDDPQSQQIDEDALLYAAPKFTRKKTGRKVRRGTNAAEAEVIYSDVRILR